LGPVEKARTKDASQINKLINGFAEKEEMLPRPLSEIYENIRDYFIIKDGQKVIACAALHVNWSDLAEIKAMAVAGDNQRQGLGNLLLKACLDDARLLGIPTVFCLTYKPGFFEQAGFYQVEKMELPHKVWNECYRCVKFPNCDEIALVYQMNKEA